MAKVVIVACALWIAAFPAFADETAYLNDFRAFLDSGDVEGLERVTSDLAETGRGEDIAIYREIAETLFRTTHPTRLATLSKWLEAYPDSSHALAANAWASIHLTYAASSGAIGYPLANEFLISRHNGEELVRERDRAQSLASAAVVADFRNVSAIDAWMHTLGWSEPGLLIAAQARNLMKLAPNRDSVLSILAGYSGAAVADPEQVRIGVCLKFADMAEDYDRERCMIDVAYMGSAAQDLKLRAAQRLRAMGPDARFDYARIDEALFVTREADANGRVRLLPDELTLNDVDQLKKWFENSLERHVSASEFYRNAKRVGYVLKAPDIGHEFNDILLEHIEAWLRDDPYNPWVLETKVRLQREAGDFAAAWDALEDLAVHSWHNDRLWQLAAYVTLTNPDLRDFEHPTEIMRAWFSAHGNNPMILYMGHHILDETLRKTASSAKGVDGAQCFALRVARLTEALCRITDNARHVCENQSSPANLAVSRRLAEPDNGMCEEIRNSRLTDLRFTEVDLKSEADRLLRNRPN